MILFSSEIFVVLLWWLRHLLVTLHNRDSLKGQVLWHLGVYFQVMVVKMD